MKNPCRVWVCFFLAATWLAAGPVQAAGIRNEHATTAASQALVKQAARGELEAAFASASMLGQAGDGALGLSLERQKQVALQGRADLGALRSVSAPGEQFFAGCVTRSFLVRYAGGTQLWMLKWRRGSEGGWVLKDLAVSGS
jgi:hypothetical protein